LSKVYIFLGPPASGKGTQAKVLSERLGVPHIALGDILREAVRKGTPLGRKAKGYMEAGKLVPDELTISLASERFAQEDCKRGFIVDGFPRTLKQAGAFENNLKKLELELGAVIYIKISVEVAISRLSGRRSCKKCGAVYHLTFNPPKAAGICDRDGGELYLRHDDEEEVIKTRFSVYGKETLPLVARFKSSGKLVEVSGEPAVAEVQSKISSSLGLD
jgi:adenylate kinase